MCTRARIEKQEKVEYGRALYHMMTLMLATFIELFAWRKRFQPKARDPPVNDELLKSYQSKWATLPHADIDKGEHQVKKFSNDRSFYGSCAQTILQPTGSVA